MLASLVFKSQNSKYLQLRMIQIIIFATIESVYLFYIKLF